MKSLDCYEFYLWSTGQIKVQPEREPQPHEYLYEYITGKE